MNCCNAYGHCTQGSNCAARKTNASHQSAGALHADWRNSQFFAELPEARKEQRHSCQELGSCQGRADCECVDGLELHSPLETPASTGPSAVPPEAGNVWFVPSDLSPPDELGTIPTQPPFAAKDKWLLGVMAVSTVLWVIALAFGAGVVWAKYGSSIMGFGSWLLNHAAAWGLPG